MELVLKNDLPHQQQAVAAVAGVFRDVTFSKPALFNDNPEIQIHNDIVKGNIAEIQKNIDPSMRGFGVGGTYLNLDIKMETGTGKTYVYVQTIYELNRAYGLNKFIIAVPSLAIKAGAQKFMESAGVRRHFRDVCGYGTEIELHVLEAKKSKKGKDYFPAAVREFVNGNTQNSRKIHVMLVNMHLLQDKKGSMLIRDDYDYPAGGFFQPAQAIQSVKPIVMIDEPHRFTKDKKTFEFIENHIRPQLMIRYGATFPDMELKAGKKKTLVKDYHNLLYNLTACDAFNRNLVKGIAKEHFEPASKTNDKVKIVTVNSRTSVNLHYIKDGEKTVTHTLQKGDPLSIVAPSLEGVSITAIGSQFIELSNSQIKFQGEEFSTDIYSSSYQENMLKLALQRHFETEKMNFKRQIKIKTLALFFIDDIHSYRPDRESGKEPYLRNAFERLLAGKIDDELAEWKAADGEEYKQYLIATKANIGASHAGYFSQDNSDTDESIAKEISEILFEKEKLLTIRNADGSFNTRRFLFSKWTLKEGWDNPNVFTIAKLRSSGSENSKLQEVGRGLRLPVDEYGNRISNEEFYLNYIVDFTEREFAEDLVAQINRDLPESLTLSMDTIEKVAKKAGQDANELFIQLLMKRYIDRNLQINPETRAAFFDEYPAFTVGLESGKIRDNNKRAYKPVAIRKERFEELRELWEKLNRKYLLYFDPIDHGYLKEQLLKMIGDGGVFRETTVRSTRDRLTYDTDRMSLVRDAGVSYSVDRAVPYHEFLIKSGAGTNLPIKLIHEAVAEYAKVHGLKPHLVNENAVISFIRSFNDWKAKHLQSRISYRKSPLPVHPTALTNADGTVKDVIAQGRIGTKLAPGTPSDKYLYDAAAYDSPLELDNIQTTIGQVTVFGKIPRNSIRIPTVTGESYSPDFIYVVNKTDGTKVLHIVVETKDVEQRSDLRGKEDIKINCAEIFYEQLREDGYEVKFVSHIKNQTVHSLLQDIINE